jgi:TonB family protein
MEPGLLDYPDFERRRGASAVVDVEVAINASGALDGAWIFAPSGSKWFNEAALRAARTSKYAGGTAYCQPANAIYIFQAVHPIAWASRGASALDSVESVDDHSVDDRGAGRGAGTIPPALSR